MRDVIFILVTVGFFAAAAAYIAACARIVGDDELVTVPTDDPEPGAKALR